MKKISMLATLTLLGAGVTLLPNAAYIFIDLSTLSEINSEAIAIRNTGQVAGSEGDGEVDKSKTS